MASDPVTMEPVSHKGKGGKDAPGSDNCPGAAGQSTFALDAPGLLVWPLPVARCLSPPVTETVLAVARATGLPRATGPSSAVLRVHQTG